MPPFELARIELIMMRPRSMHAGMYAGWNVFLADSRILGPMQFETPFGPLSLSFDRSGETELRR